MTSANHAVTVLSVNPATITIDQTINALPVTTVTIAVRVGFVKGATKPDQKIMFHVPNVANVSDAATVGHVHPAVLLAVRMLTAVRIVSPVRVAAIALTVKDATRAQTTFAVIATGATIAATVAMLTGYLQTDL